MALWKNHSIRYHAVKNIFQQLPFEDIIPLLDIQCTLYHIFAMDSETHKLLLINLNFSQMAAIN